MKHKVKEIIQSIEMTQKELAEKANITEVGLSKMISSGNASKSSLQKIAKAIGIDLKDIVNERVMPIAKYEGVLNIGNKELTCAVLDDNRRILTATAIFDAFDRPRKGKSNETYRADQMPSFINANNLQPFVDDDIRGWTELIEYKDLNGQVKQGYNARVLRGLCKIYIDARNANALLKSQERFAAISEVLLYALSDVGIVALVDEATGYDKVKTRAKDELQKFINSILSHEASKWVKTFSDDFFEMIFKMHNWTWTGASQKPSVIGVWINDIVYERLAPTVLKELRTRNPKNDNGNRTYKHHQFLTENVGYPKLKEHIAGVMAIGRISNNNWGVFMRNLDKAYPKQYQQLPIDFEE